MCPSVKNYFPGSQKGVLFHLFPFFPGASLGIFLNRGAPVALRCLLSVGQISGGYPRGEENDE